MPKKNKEKTASTKVAAPITHVALILDGSGSMDRHKQETIDGFNEQLQSIRSNVAQGDDVRVTSVIFRGTGLKGVKRLVVKGRIEDVGELTAENYRPNGDTPMYDAVGDTIVALSDEDVADTDVAFLFVIISDGQENSSGEWVASAPAHKGEKIAALIREKQANGRWSFMYIGANQNLAQVTQHMGIQQQNVYGYEPTGRGMSLMNSALSNSNRAYLSARSRGLSPEVAATEYRTASGQCDECHYTSGQHNPTCSLRDVTP
jgi:Mg-chelatase subunit ChlD